MKKLWIVLLCLFLPISARAQVAGSVSVLNPRVVGNELKFDVYMKSTGSPAVFISDCNFAWYFNYQKFTNPTFSFTPTTSKLATYYQFPASLKPPTPPYTTAYLDVFQPIGVNDSASFATRVQEVSSTGNGTMIGTATISGITDFTGTAGLAFRTDFPYYVLTYSMRPTSPFTSSRYIPTLDIIQTIQLGAVFDATVRNQSLVGSDYTFDIYTKQTDGQALNLDNSTFTLLFNNALFTNPQVSIVSRGTAKLTSYYGMTASIPSAGTCSLALTAPTTSTQSDFDTKIEVVTNANIGIKVATVKISGANSGISINSINLQWVTSASATPIRSRRNLASWNTGDVITSNGTYSVMPAALSLSLSAPNGNQAFCAGSTQNVTWSSINISAVKIEILDQTGGFVSTVATMIPATLASYSWTVNHPAGNYFLRISDVANAQTNDVSDAFFTIQQQPTITNHPQNLALCVGQSGTFSSTGIGTPAPTIQWQIGNDETGYADISGATSATYSVTSATLAQNGRSIRVKYTNSCGSVFSNPALLTVYSAPSFSVEPSLPQFSCVGDNVQISAILTGTPTPSLQWQSSTNGGQTWSDIANASSATLLLQNVQLAQSGRQYRLIASNLCQSGRISSVATLTVYALPQITQSPQNASACAGGTAQFTANASGTPAPSVQWQVSANGGQAWSNVQNANSSTLILSNILAQQNGFLYRALFSSPCGNVPSNAAMLTVGSSPQITLQPLSLAVCEGGTAVFSASAGANPPALAQWEQSVNNGQTWTEIPNATSETLSVPNVALSMSGYRYRVVYSNFCSQKASSTEAVLTVNIAPIITQNPQNSAICEGGSVLFQAGANGNPVPTIQWQMSANGGQSWENIQGATSASLPLASVQANQNGRLFRALFFNQCSVGVPSSSAVLTVFSPPVITVQPYNITVCDGATLLIQSSANAFPAPTVQWQVSTDGGTNWTAISQATSAAFVINKVSMEMNGNRYRALFSNQCRQNVTSASLVLTVNQPPVISRQPESVRVCRGESAQFISTASGIPKPMLKWQSSFDGGQSWVTLSGAQSDTLSLTNIQQSQNGTIVRAWYANSCADTVLSLNALLTVNTKQSITKQPESLTAIVSETAVFSVKADSVKNISYRWFKGVQPLSDGGRISGAGTTTLTIQNLQPSDAGNDYFVQISGECGIVSSASVALSIRIPGLEISEQPKSSTLCIGEMATLRITASTDVTGATLSYKWRRGSVELSDNARYSGTNSSVLTIGNLQPSDAGTNYNVMITINPSGLVGYSANASLTVHTPPVILEEPKPVRICEGETSALDVKIADSDLASQFQWFLGGQKIAGATSARYIIAQTTPSATGEYYCIVKNTCGESKTSSAVISLKKATVILKNPKDTLATFGKELRLSVAADGDGTLTYRWFKNGELVFIGNAPEFIIPSAQYADTGRYICKVRGECGETSSSEAVVRMIVSGVEEMNNAERAVLSQNFPNPFETITTISVFLPRKTMVRLVLLDLLGREVLTVFEGNAERGNYDFRADCSHIPAGIYTYSLRLDSEILTQRLLIIR